MDENERYEQICKPNFAKTDRKLDKIIDILQGNGKPGLLTRVDHMELKCQAATGVLGFAAKNWQIGVVLLILIVNLFTGGEKIDPDRISQIAKEVELLKILVPVDVSVGETE